MKLFSVLFSSQWLFACILLMLSVSAQGATASSLYQTNIEGTYQPQQLNKAVWLESAFVLAAKKVLAKVSGKVEAAKLPVSLGQGKQWVSSYRVVEESQLDEMTYHLNVSFVFSPVAIDDYLKKKGFESWSSGRLSSLNWILIEPLPSSSDSAVTLLSEANIDDQWLKWSASKNRETVAEDRTVEKPWFATFEQLGFEAELPSGDAKDQATVDVADFLGEFDQNIDRASERYPTDQVWIYHLKQATPTLWRGRYRGLHQTWQKDSELYAFDGLLNHLTHQVTEKMHEQHEVVKANKRLLTVTVAGMTQLEQWHQLDQWIHQHVSGLQSLRLLSVKGDRWTFVVDANQTLDQLARHIRVFKHTVQDHHVVSDQDNHLYLRWM